VLSALRRRDSADSTREHSPLSAANDAVLVDTTGVAFQDVVHAIAHLARERGA
jgi:CMP/dCMP kinase